MRENNSILISKYSYLSYVFGPRFLILLFLISGCTKLEPVVIVITATSTPETTKLPIESTLEYTSVPFATSSSDLIQDLPATPTTETYVVQAGDTLSGIAAKFEVSIETLLKVNRIVDPNVLEVGQIIALPRKPSSQSLELRIISDGRFVKGPNSKNFDVNTFIMQQKGYIQTASDTVDEVILRAADVVQRVSIEYGVDSRLLLSILEYRSRWLTQTNLDDNIKQFPIQGKPSPDGFDRSGLYKQLSWAANQLNAGYYGWKYKGVDVIEFDDGTRLRYSSKLNAGTIGVQYFFSLQSDYMTWENAVGANGLFKTYNELFGDPLTGDTDILVPNNLIQPELTFPFPPEQTWFFTGGPHGGWGSGSAWAAIDFAPPDDRPEGSTSCYISDYWGTAVASGVIVRSEDGAVVLDLDGDGDETTGWTILYLHIASDGRVPLGIHVNVGDNIGRPSCEGGFSNATHMHIARRYNGEWIPITCDVCRNDKMPPPFVMNGWTVVGLENQENQGYMIKSGDRRDAEQGRLTPINRISW